MNMRYLIVDGMLSGTGVRDAIEGGYLDLHELGLSSDFIKDILLWVRRYEDAHYAQFDDKQEVTVLDSQGLALCKGLEKNFRNRRLNISQAQRCEKFVLVNAEMSSNY